MNEEEESIEGEIGKEEEYNRKGRGEEEKRKNRRDGNRRRV
jgi:hypothetical protein